MISERESKKQYAPKKIKYFGINLTKEVKEIC